MCFFRKKVSQSRWLPLITWWLIEDIEAYAPKFPIHDPYAIRGALPTVVAFFFVLGSNYPDRVAQLLQDSGHSADQVEDYLKTKSEAVLNKEKFTLQKLSDVWFQYHIREICTKQLRQRGISLEGDQDPAMVALNEGLDRATTMAIFQRVVYEAVAYGMIWQLHSLEMVKEFQQNFAATLDTLSDVMAEDLQQQLRLGVMSIGDFEHEIKRAFHAYDQEFPTKRGANG